MKMFSTLHKTFKFVYKNVNHNSIVLKFMKNNSINKKNGNIIRRYCASLNTDIVVKSSFTDINIPERALPEFIFEHLDQWRNDNALTCCVTEKTYTFSEVYTLSCRLAASLLEQCGLKPGDMVGIILPNIPEYAIAIYGAVKAGQIVTFINPNYTKEEVSRLVSIANTKFIITTEQLLPIAKYVEPQLNGFKGIISIGGKDEPDNKVYSLETLLKKEWSVKLPKLNNEDVVMLPFSSGTVGLPKGVSLTHKNLIVNLLQVQGERLMKHYRQLDCNQDILLTVLPFFHIFGLNGIVNLCLRHGYKLVSMPKFVPEVYIDALIKYRPQHLYVVPSLMMFLASHPHITKNHLSSVRTVLSGAAPLSSNLINKFKQKIDRDDVHIMQGYGMTESSPVTLITPHDIPPSKDGSCGLLVANTEAKIVDIETGQTFGPNQPGELCVRGPQVMKGYWKNEEATRHLIDADGWVHTGDVAYYDSDHYFYIVDRTKELIKVKGNQVSPTELETIILEIVGVADVAVVGILDEAAGELPRAFVVRKPNSEHVTKDVINKHVNPKVIAYKQLAGGIQFIDSVPRNSSGKILRKNLMELYKKN